MTYIRAEVSNKSLHVRITNHCRQRDVCIAISAIANTLCQYTEFFRDETGGIRVDELRCAPGDVEIEVKCNKNSLAEYIKGARAIMIGFELYAANYPEEVVAHIG